MQRRDFTLAGLSAAAIAASQVAFAQQGERAAPQQPGKHEHKGYSDHFRDCAEACSDCQRECDRCAMHCATMLSHSDSSGHSHHKTLQTCMDCADMCAAAAQIVSRGGPFSADICAACADACRKCADACKQHGDDPKMKACAEECEKCEKACRSMLRTTDRSTPAKPAR